MVKKSKNVLVTGAGGFIGSHLCEGLVRENYKVFGLVRSKNNERLKRFSKNKMFRSQKCDVTDLNSLNAIIKRNKIDAILHLAALMPGKNDLEDPFPIFNTNIGGTLNLLSSARKNGVRNFVYASTMSVYTDPPEYLPVDENHPTSPSTVYGAAKLAGELLCRPYAKFMNITIFRFGGAYGPREQKHKAVHRFIHQALKNEPITIYGNGRQSTDLIYIDDVVRLAILTVKKNKTGLYNLGSGEETSIKNLAQKIIKITGSKSKITSVRKKTDRPFRFFMDIEKARKTFHYSPTSLDRGLIKYISLLKKEKI